MLRLKLKRIGKKHFPAYRLVILENKKSQSIAKLGYYNPIKKILKLNKLEIKKWLNYGVKPTNTVYNLIKKANLI
uniref:30S ribosomal protein S16 n=1 Tax=Nitzschia alba TaxID=2858 RepID=A0A5C0F3E4_NITAL|nr:30S ribosomal protein S16 [Nitzschia alba]QEI59593.1 30S ribosomal protein S16 [Nitzschia alba]